MKEDTTVYLFTWLCWSKGITHGEHHAQKMAFLWLPPFYPITSTLPSIILLFFRWARFSLLFAHPLTSTQISSRNSLAVQWLGLHASTAAGPRSIPGWGTKIPLGTTRKIPLSIPFVQYWGYPFPIHCCWSVTKSCPTLCNPMNCSTPGFPVLHSFPQSLLRLMSIHKCPHYQRSCPRWFFSGMLSKELGSPLLSAHPWGSMIYLTGASQVAQVVKNPPANAEDRRH